jgi:hypothetical protein
MVVECSLMVEVLVRGDMLTMIDSSWEENVILSTLYHINHFLLPFKKKKKKTLNPKVYQTHTLALMYRNIASIRFSYHSNWLSSHGAEEKWF